jgi:glyoxylase-like metal-dependent hydrolase (beta-lactamase superfamily II)
MQIETFFDEATWTLTYVVFDEATKDAVIIDPVLDFDPLAVAVSTRTNDEVVSFVRDRDLKVHYILETHAHADHLSGSQDLKERLGAKVGIGAKITVVQQMFKGVFNLPDSIATDGSQFDVLLDDGEVLEAGSLRIETLHTPGHTPACATYRIEDAVFTGDALFMPDFGTGRCDFPAGSAEDLYDSITTKLYTLPDETRVFVGHDYMPGGRELRYESTIGEEKEHNLQLPASRSREDFVKFRTERDATLNPPKLIFQSVQVNVDAGKLPDPEDNGRAYLKLPINLFG